MYIVYVLYSVDFDKTYVGFTSDLESRVISHNIKATKGYTIKFRPWIIIHQESFENKTAAIAREKYFKSGSGRQLIKSIKENFLKG